MALYKTNASSPFHSAMGAMGNAQGAIMNAAQLQRMYPRKTLGGGVKSGLQGAVGGLMAGKLIGELGAKEGWWDEKFPGSELPAQTKPNPDFQGPIQHNTEGLPDWQPGMKADGSAQDPDYKPGTVDRMWGSASGRGALIGAVAGGVLALANYYL